jgi:predicted glutamine amidotransferase
MRETLGDLVLDEFLELAGVHRDGWGIVRRHSNSLSSYISTISACRDVATFNALTAQPIDSAIMHMRWASPGIGLVLDNQQPFVYEGMALAHNGTIGNDEGNIVMRPASYRESIGLVHSTTMSDSRIYADLFFLRLAELQQNRQSSGRPPSADEVRQSLALTIARLRQDYADASFNNVIETADFTFATRAHADKPECSEGLRHRYGEMGWSHRIDDYYELAYKTFPHDDGSVTSVVSSSGYSASDLWPKLANNAILAISHRDATVQTMSLEV